MTLDQIAALAVSGESETLEKLRELQFVMSTGRGPSARWKRRVREQDR